MIGALARECRRLARGGGILSHLLAGLFITHALFPLLDRLGPGGSEAWRLRLIRGWARRLCRLLNLRPQITGEPCTGPVLFVANHISWIDIPCLLALLDASFVAKHDVRRWPLIGAMANRTGTIFLKRGASGAATAAADQITWRLARGHRVIVFPEGTTTDGTAVAPFHARLFQAAVRVGGIVQPIALHYPTAHGPSRTAPFIGDDGLLPHLWSLLGEERIDVRVTFCPPYRAAGDRRRLALHARTAISERLACGGRALAPPSPEPRETATQRTAARRR